ncbi:hypothetical protein MVEN_01319400 [Mycena venus]|uniref:DUF7330 domain-containing protein n=1 Tax=Mycena venus TaxID=2733690 RepID=A0A8H7CTT8_9AGAR|nr:hypothetical protein MVEN_01319400 [Mycena venus]
MIIPQDSDSKLKDFEQTDVTVNRAPVQDDTPPAYSNSQSDAQPVTKAKPTDTSLPPIPAVKPTNFVSLSRGNNSIKGTYVIDPCIKIPQPMLPPLAADETEATRRNMHLHTSNGSIDVDLFVVGDGKYKQKVNISLKSSNGSIVARLVRYIDALLISAQSVLNNRSVQNTPAIISPPINLKAQTSSGTVTIHVPRGFRGPVLLTTRNGSVRFSDTLSADLTTFNEVNHTRRYFIGDFSDWTETDQSEGWMGDELGIETSNGNIELQYAAEASSDTGSKGKGKGLFARLLGV